MLGVINGDMEIHPMKISELKVMFSRNIKSRVSLRNSKLCFWSTIIEADIIWLINPILKFIVTFSKDYQRSKILGPKQDLGFTFFDGLDLVFKGVFTWHLGNFHPEASSLRFPLMALYLFTWYHHKMLCRRKSPRHKLTPALVPGQEFHSSTKTRSGIM